VIDVGCGEGHAAGFFRGIGCKVLGIDGSRQARAASVIPDAHVLHDYQDAPFDPAWRGLGKQWDLVWSCEFVEHVDERFVPNFLVTFSAARKYLMITYAHPGQPGWHHVNCRDEDYWIEKVVGAGFRFDGALTRKARELAHDHFFHRGLVFSRTNWTKSAAAARSR
jgi:SAM-dependent methyltransferase